MVIIGQVHPPNEGIVFTTDNVQLKVDQQTVGKGNVYISQSSLMWKPNNNGLQGISIFWKRISVHGITNAPTKAIYLVIDRQFKWPNTDSQNAGNGNGHAAEANGDGDNSDSDEEVFQDAEEDQITECWLLPEDTNVVDTMYQAMTECQSLHPDSEDSISEDSDLMEDDENADFDDADEYIHNFNGSGEVDSARANMNNLSLDDDRFADADE
ncbi:methylosome subunit pICln [Stomoxys calcitrans]|uniref:methylosome subunit pICln n=1 Tax=Stomoxys calcitrans TaxID=35570 RepID=UPI0027E296B1|nr:methylosome subunit pICln [Stomoxys calcitrans]